MILHDENINSIIEHQLDCWQEARDNFFRLKDCRRKNLRIGEWDCAAQFNPARIRSTGADVSDKAIKERKCFLCAENRPEQQLKDTDWMQGWELLVNPYPILPVHFTIASVRHEPQSETPIDMAAMAESAPSLAFFYNGAKAGASAPDHLHVQAVLASELPLLNLAAKYHPVSKSGFMDSKDFGINLPFRFVSAVITPDPHGMLTLSRIPEICGADASGKPDKGLVNAFFFMDKSGILRAVIVPRRAHRPKCWYASDSTGMMISPGAIDMAGIAILPREEDFTRINSDLLADIYRQVAYTDELPQHILEML